MRSVQTGWAGWLPLTLHCPLRGWRQEARRDPGHPLPGLDLVQAAGRPAAGRQGQGAEAAKAGRHGDLVLHPAPSRAPRGWGLLQARCHTQGLAQTMRDTWQGPERPPPPSTGQETHPGMSPRNTTAGPRPGRTAKSRWQLRFHSFLGEPLAGTERPDGGLAAGQGTGRGPGLRVLEQGGSMGPAPRPACPARPVTEPEAAVPNPSPTELTPRGRQAASEST